MNKIILFLLLTFFVSRFTYSQIIGGTPQSELGIGTIINKTYTLNEVETDSALLSVERGIRSIIVDTTFSTSNITLQPNQEQLADSNRWFTNLGAWDTTGNMGAVWNSDSSVTLGNIPTELNPNPYFDFSYTELVINGGSEADVPKINNVAFSYFASSGAVSTEQYYSESKSFKVTSTSNGATCRIIPKNAAYNGKIYYLECYVYIPSSQVNPTLKLYSMVNGALVLLSQTSTKGSWVKLSGIYAYGSTPATDRAIHIEHLYTGTTESYYVDNISFTELIAPTGWTSSTMDANNYVLEDANGIQFKEVTGTTSISLSGLTNGQTYRVINNLYSRTSGELNVYNGSTETAFSTSLGLDTVEVTMVGTTLTLQVDNNSDLVSSYLSITEVHETSELLLADVVTENDKFYQLNIDAKSDSTSRKLYYNYGSVSDSLSLTSSYQTITKEFIGQGTDTLRFWATENTTFDLKNISLEEITSKLLVRKDSTEKVYFTPNTSTVGAKTGAITLNNNKVVTVNWEVVYEPQIIAIDDTAFFNDGNEISAITDYTVKFYNPSAIDLIVLPDYTYTTFSPFSSIDEYGLAEPSDTASYTFRINPSVDSLYQKTFRFVAIDLEYNPIDTNYIVFYANVNVPSDVDTTLGTPVLALVDSVGEVNLSWGIIDNALGYRVYRDDVLIETVTTNSFTETINPFYEVDYKVTVFDSLTSETSNVVSTTMLPNGVQGTDYFLVSAVDGSANYDNIDEVNDSLAVNKFAYFKSAEQFDDAILAPKQNQSYGTYGGSEKAIIGDSSFSGFTSYTNTIIINNENVTLNNLKIYGYANGGNIITFSKGNLIISNCEISGGYRFYQRWVKAIFSNAPSISGIKISNNIIRDAVVALQVYNPYDFEISYNTVYNIYLYPGYAAVGGIAFLFERNSTTTYFDTEYTLHIHHNEVYNFEHSAFGIASMRNTLVEYNYVHDNLDERLYQGGMKNGTFGKIGEANAALSNVVRYNFIANLRKYGEVGHSYARPSLAQFEAGTINDALDPINADEAPYYPNSGDAAGSTAYEYPYHNILGGGGYRNEWVHNNLFYNINGTVISRQRSESGGIDLAFNSQYGSFYINNTFLNVGNSFHGNKYGVIHTAVNSQSPSYIYNNIIDFTSPNGRGAIYAQEDGTYADYNIFTRTSGVYSGYPNLNSLKSYFYLYTGANDASGSNQYDLTNPNWIDTTSTFFAQNIGSRGAYIPNVRIWEGGNAYNKGMPFNLIGDSYNGFGEDPTGRSFAYDMLGNLRTTNDIGALGIPVIDSVLSVPSVRITQQPTNQTVNETETATFIVYGTTDNTGNVGYQWWRSPYVSQAVSKIVDGGKFSGATTNTLTITNVTETEASDNYACEVKNLQDYPNTFVNSNVVDLAVVTGSAIQDSIEVVTGGYRDDVYWYSSASYNISNSYINVGNVTSSNNAFLRFRSVSIPDGAVADSAYIIINAYNPSSTTTVNLIVYGEDSATPLQFDIPTDAEARTLTTASTTLNNVGWTTNAVDYTIDVTDIINELLTSYNYSLGDIAFQIRDNSSSSGAYRRFRTGESGVYPTLKVYYTE